MTIDDDEWRRMAMHDDVWFLRDDYNAWNEDKNKGEGDDENDDADDDRAYDAPDGYDEDKVWEVLCALCDATCML